MKSRSLLGLLAALAWVGLAVLDVACTQPLPQEGKFATVDIVHDVGVDAASDLGADGPADALSDVQADGAPDTVQGADAADVAEDVEQDLADSQPVDVVIPDIADDLADVPALPDAEGELPADVSATDDTLADDVPMADVPIIGNLSFAQGPSDVAAGVAMVPAIQVALVDDGGTVLDQASAEITLALASGPAGAKLSGTKKAQTVSGVATFGDITLDKAGSYTLVASAPGYGKYVSDVFQVSAGKAVSVGFVVQPSAVAAGAAIAPAVKVAIEDAYGNAVTAASTTIALKIGSGPAGAKLGGVAAVDTVDGVAEFDDLVLTKAGPAYTLVAFALDLKSATSAEFAVSPGAPAQLGFLTQPADNVAGLPFAPAVKVLLKDAYGNKISTATDEITMSLGTNAAAAQLLGTNKVAAAAGVAVFGDLAVDKVGAGYTLVASAPGFAPVTSPPFQIKPGSASALAFAVEPKSTTAGVATTAQVSVVDAWGNKIATATPDIELSVGANAAGATLTGATKATAVAGVAQFGDVRLEKAAKGYRLIASATGLADGQSALFDVTAANATHLNVTGQPIEAVAGVTLTPGVTAQIEDEFGNLVQDSTLPVTVKLASNVGGASLAGTTTVAAQGGVVAFSDLVLDKIGVGYTLALEADGLGGAWTAPFSVLWGVPVQLAIVAQPTSAVAGVALAPSLQVALQDAFGNTVPQAGVSVSLALSGGGADAVLAGSVKQDTDAGIATFPGLSINRAGSGYQLLASAADQTGALSVPFDVACGPASRLAFGTQPGGGLAGVALKPASTVRIEDAFGNVVESASSVVSIALGTGPEATLSGTTSAKAVAGVAEFANLVIDKAGKGYSLNAQAAALEGASSAPFDIDSGAATRLSIQVQPIDAKAGTAIQPGVRVAILDAAGNPATGATPTVTMAIGANPGGATLLGQVSVQAVAGIAQFDDVRLDKADSGYTLTVSAEGLVGDTSVPFSIAAGAAHHVEFVDQPVDSTAGATWAPLRLSVEDQFDNPVSAAQVPVTLALQSSDVLAKLAGTTTLGAVAGTAQFSDLSVSKAGTGYALNASAPGLVGATSSTFAVAPGAAARLSFAVQPSSAVAGAALSPALVVQVEDSFGNATTTDGASISLVLASNPGGAALLGSTTASTVQGKASFADVAVDKVANGYTLAASSGSLAGATSAPFDVSFTLPTALAIAAEPTTTAAGAAFVPSVRVAVVDDFGNTVAGASTMVTLSFLSNPGGAKLLGTVSVAAVDGVATFADLALDKAGTGYRLTASAGMLKNASTQPFDIIPGAAKMLAIVAQPSSGTAGVDLNPGLLVQVQDAYGNRVPGATDTVTIALDPASVGATLSGGSQLDALDGSVTFDGLRIDKAGSHLLVASAPGLTKASSAPIAITASIPASLQFFVQPSDVAAGSAMAPVVVVHVVDLFGNLVTTATNTIALQIGQNPSGGALLGGASSPAVGGVATFTDVRLDKAGTAYSLAALADGLQTVMSLPFDVKHGVGTHLGVLSQPLGATAGKAFDPTLQFEVLDAFGNRATSEAHAIQLGVVQGPSGGAVTGTTSANTVGGVATFADVGIVLSGSGYVLGASSPGIDAAQTSPFDVVFSVPTHLGFLTQPSDGVATVPVNPAVQIAALDAYGNTVTTATPTVTVALGANAANATLGGTLAQKAVKGLATFANLTLDKVGAGFTLVASSPEYASPATSTPFAMAAGGDLRLVFTVQPTTTTAGASMTPVLVTVMDKSGVIDTTATQLVTLSIGNNQGGSSLGGTVSAAMVAGVATFSDLVLDKSGEGYTLLGVAPGVTAAVSSPFTVVPAAPAQLAFVVQPSNTVAGLPFSAAPQVAVQDTFGNTITSATDKVTVSLAPTGAGNLGGTTAVNVSGSVATFADLTIDKAGSGYSLVAKAPGLATVASSTFQVAAGAPSHLVFAKQPGASVAGEAISPAVQVLIEDAFDNVVTTSTLPITLAVSQGPVGATLTGTTTANAAAGSAAFQNLVLTRAGAGYKLSATAGTLPVAVSASFDLAPAAPSKLAFAVQPSHSTAGVSMSPAVKVVVQDAFGNSVVSTATVALGLGANPGATSWAGVSADAVDGTASFASIALDKAGSGYTLTASANGLSGATSTSFNIVAAAASRLTFVSQPSNTVAGVAMAPAVKLQVEDAFGNTVTTSSASVSLALVDASGLAVPASGTSASASAGIVTFGNVSIDRAGSAYHFAASSPSLTGTGSSTFDVAPAAAAKVVFSVQPGSVVAGAAISPDVKVAVQDAFGNALASSTANVKLVIANNAGGGTLTGTLSANAVGGVASFADLHLDKAGVGYTLSATSGTLTSATSAAFTVGFASPTRLAFTTQPTSVVAGAVFAPAVKLAVLDSYGNTVTSATTAVTLGIGANPGGSTLNATSSASGGVVAFASSSLSKVGNGYTLTAQAAGLTGATSDAFNVSAAAAHHLAFVAQPGSATAGLAITPVVKVGVFDAYDNALTAYAASVTVTLGQNPGGASLAPQSAAATGGTASFANLILDKSGAGYTLLADSAGLVQAKSDAFSVSAGAASRLSFQVQPKDGIAGNPLTSFQVSVQDANGNLVSTATPQVALSLSANPGGATILGGASATAVSGVATFGGLSLDKAASGYRLSATVVGLSAATSDPFAITAGTAQQLAFVTPPTDVAAGAPMGVFKLAIQDIYGNTVTTAGDLVTLALSTNPVGATLLSGSSANAVGGVATFDALSLDRVGSGFKLTATAGALSASPSAAFAVTAGAPAKLAFATQPTDVVAGATMGTVKVSVLDAFGNATTASAPQITLGLGNNPGGASFLPGATATVSPSAGIATFANLSLDKVGSGYTFTAAGSGLSGATSGGFAVSAGAAQKLGFLVQPSDVAAGKLMASVKVVVQDAYGNTVTIGSPTVQLNLAVNPAGATLLVTPSAAASAGVATFDNVSLDKAGAGFKLGATAGGLSAATSTTFAVTGGDAAKLAFVIQPVTVAAGATMAKVDVAVRDAFDNPVSAATPSIALALSTGTLLGTTPVSAVAGVSHFSDLHLTKVATGLTLTATSPGLTAATSTTFDVTPGSPYALSFKVQPANATAGIVMGPAPQVSILDQWGNAVTDATNTVSVALGKNPGSAVLLDAVSASAVGGVATLDGVRLNKVGTAYSLSVTSPGLTSAESGNFDVTYGAANKLAFGTQPATSVAGTTLTNLTVNVLDAYDNAVANASNVVTLDFATNPAGGTLIGAASIAANKGVATLSGLSIQKAGTGYQFSASAVGLNGAQSSTFDITAAAAKKVAFTKPPTNTAAGVPISPAVEVSVQDNFGNKVSSAVNDITLAIGTNPGSATLSGTKTVKAAGGTATFADLSLNVTGNGYTLSATATGGLTSDTSSTFNITPNTSLRLAFFTVPSSTVAGVAMSSVVVKVQDSLGNVVTTSTAPVTLAIGTNPGSATLSGTKTVSAVAGIATFGDLSLNKAASGYTLLASTSTPGITAGVSSTFAITAAAAAKLLVSAQPAGSITAGTAVAPTPGGALTVSVVDAFDNTVTSATNSIALALDTNAVGASLSGTTSLAAASGVASFAGALVTKSGTGFRVVASTSGLTSVYSNTFDVTPAAAAKLAYAVQPAKTTAGVAIAPAIKVDVQDNWGNLVTAATNQVALAVQSGPAGATISGGSAAAASGAATFSNVILPKAGSYVLTASAVNLTSANSSAFTIDPAVGTTLAIATQPANAAAGAAISPAVSVAVLDDFGNTATASTASISLSIAAGPGTLTGGGAVSAVAGVATFANLKLDKVGTYRLQASASGLAAVTTGQFTVSAGTPTKLVFKTQPSNAAAGASLGSVQVEFRDANDNLCDTQTSSITLATTVGSGPGALQGNLTVAASGGIATWTGLSLNAVGTYKITASNALVGSVDSAQFTVTAGVAASLSFTQQPNATVAGVAISPAVAVTVLDAFGNVVTGAASNVTVTLASSPVGATLGGGGAVAPTSGVATFGGLVLTKAGAYVLRATYNSLTADSANLSVSAAAASAAHCTLTPSSSSATADGTASITLTALIRDVYDNPISGQTVALSSTGSNQTLSQPATATNATGTTSGTMASTKAEAKTVSAVIAGTTLASTTVTFTPGAVSAAHCQLVPAPLVVTANGSATMTLTATIRDVYDNPISGASVSLTATGTSNTLVQPVSTTGSLGSTSGTLASTKAESKTVNALVAGTVVAYATVSFTAGAVDGPHSSISAAPTSPTAGNSAVITVTARDAYDNPVSGQLLTLSCSGAGNTITQPATASNSTGQSTGSILSTKAESKTVTATFANGATVSLANWIVQPGTVNAVHSTLSAAPASATADGSTSIALTATIRDAYDNPISGQTVAFASTGTANSISPASVITTASGVAVGSISSTKAETKTVSANIAGTTVASTSVTFTPGAIAVGHCSIVPTTNAPTVNSTVSLTVTARDFYDNTVPNTAVSLTLVGDANVTSPSAVTNANGQATGSLFATVAGSKTVSWRIGINVYASATVVFGAGPATKLVFTQQPTSTIAGLYVSPIKVELRDAWDNLVPDSNNSVTLSLAPGVGDATAYWGTKTIALEAGVSTFSDLWLTYAANGYQFNATASIATVAGATSTAFNVTPNSAAGLVVKQQPSTTVAGYPIAPAPTVAVVDTFGNTVTTSSATITASLLNPPAGLVLNGSLNADAASGVATFGNLFLGAAGSYTLHFSAAIGSANSNAYSVVAGTPSAATSTLTALTSAVVAASPSTGITLTATIKDAYGNAVSGLALTMYSAEAADFFGPAPNTNSAGQSSMTMGSTKSGTRSVSVRLPDGTTLASANVTFMAGAVVNMAAVTSPQTQYADGISNSQLTGTLTDQWGNPISGEPMYLQYSCGGIGYSSYAGNSNTAGSYTWSVNSTATGTCGFWYCGGNYYYDDATGETWWDWCSAPAPVTFVPARPVINSVSYVPPLTGCSTLTYSLYQTQSMPCDVTWEYSTNGTTWNRMTQAGSTTARGTSGVPSSNAGSGVSNTFVWNSTADLRGLSTSGVSIRVSARVGSSAGSPYTVSNLSVGNGLSFGTAAPYTAGSNPEGFVVTDLNRDGKLDIVVSNLNGSNVSVLVGATGGTFAAAVNYTTGASPNRIIAADFNRDGKMDIAVATGGSIDVLRGNGDGTLLAKTSTTAASPYGLAAADLNGDGAPDMVCSTTSGTTGYAVILNGGTGTFPASATSISAGSASYAVALGDLNGDGKADLALGDATAAAGLKVLIGSGSGSFGTAVSYAAPYVIGRVAAIADVDNDGKQDILLTSGTLNNAAVSFYKGNGDGTVAAAVNRSLGGYAEDMAVGDANGDGKLDVVTVGTYDDIAAVSLGNGDGTFKTGITVGVGTSLNPYGVALADINRDGRPDVVGSVYSGVATDIIVVPNSMPYACERSVGATAVTTVGTNPAGLASADINGDAKPDIVTANKGASDLSVLLGKGNGTFTAGTAITVTASYAPAAVTLSDFNKDGSQDLVIGANNAAVGGYAVYTYAGSGNGTFPTLKQTLITTSPVVAVAVADVTGDTYPDVIALSASTVTVFKGLGTGFFTAGMETTLTGCSTAAQMVAKDMDKDGRPDLAVVCTASANNFLMLQALSTGQFVVSAYTVGSNPKTVATADFNADGFPDFVFEYGGSISLYAVLGNGTSNSYASSKSLTLGTNQTPNAVATGDFNGDGLADIAVSVGSTLFGRYLVLAGDGAANFTTTAYESSRTALQLATGDFNGDGRLDVAGVYATNSTTPGSVDLLLSSGASDFLTASPVASGTTPYDIEHADFNRDGKQDIAVVNASDNTISVLLGDGAGKLGTPTAYTLPTPRGMTVGDWNGDGIPDILSANLSATTGLSMMTGTVTGAFSVSTASTQPYYARAAVAGDFNLDGKLDAFVAIDTTTDSICPMEGSGGATMTYKSGQCVNVTNGPRSILAADFNNDGKLDVVSCSGINSNPLTVLTNTSVSPGWGFTTTTISLGTSPCYDMALGDVNGDGKVDIIVVTGTNLSPYMHVLTNTSTLAATSFSATAVPNPDLFYATAISTADLNNDGWLDVVVGTNTTSIAVGLGDGTGAASWRRYGGTVNTAWSLTTADLNNDGLIDIIPANTNGSNYSNAASIFLGRP